MEYNSLSVTFYAHGKKLHDNNLKKNALVNQLGIKKKKVTEHSSWG